MKSRSHTKAHPDTPLLEWIFGSLGAALFIFGVGFLVVEGLHGNDNPGRVDFQVHEMAPAGDAFYVRYSAHNLGTLTLADLHIRAELKRDEITVETAHGTLDYLPGESTRTGGFFLRQDPRGLDLVISAEGYQDP